MNTNISLGFSKDFSVSAKLVSLQDFKSLAESERVSFVEEKGAKGPQATNVKKL